MRSNAKIQWGLQELESLHNVRSRQVNFKRTFDTSYYKSSKKTNKRFEHERVLLVMLDRILERGWENHEANFGFDLSENLSLNQAVVHLFNSVQDSEKKFTYLAKVSQVFA